MNKRKKTAHGLRLSDLKQHIQHIQHMAIYYN